MEVSDSAKANLLFSKTVAWPQWEKIFLALFHGQLSTEKMKTILLLMAKKGEGTPEIWGCLCALHQLERPHSVSLPFLMDICGTGGDGAQTFNISTVSGFVIAAAGGYVAKHGNRAVSSQTGSSDLMEALGVRLEVPYRTMRQALHQCHLGYFHAPLYHPHFSKVQALRQELGIRTIFNLLGPLVNPVELPFQMIGVSNPEWLRPVVEVLRRLKRRRAAVFHSFDGLDELSTHAPSDILYLEGNTVRNIRLDPKKLGFSKASKTAYEGGDLKTNSGIALGVLKNRLRGPCKEIVCLNSGFAVWMIGLASSIQEGIEISRHALRTGRALEVLEALRRFTNQKVRS